MNSTHSYQRMNADVMEIDIAEVIARLEAEQTLVIGREQRRRANHRMRRSVVGRVLRWLRG